MSLASPWYFSITCAAMPAHTSTTLACRSHITHATWCSHTELMVACHITESHIITACLISNHLLFSFQQQTNDATSTWSAHHSPTSVTWHTHGMAYTHVAPVRHVPGTRVEKAKCDHYLGGVFSCDMADALISTNSVCVAAWRTEHSQRGVCMYDVMCCVISGQRWLARDIVVASRPASIID